MTPDTAEFGSTDSDSADFDLDDGQLRAAGSLKWNWAPADVLPAWVAEMDVRPCPVVMDAVRQASSVGLFGYAAPGAEGRLAEATAAFLEQRFGHRVDPGRVLACPDALAGIRLALETLCDPAPVVVPTPAYSPFLHVVPLTGRRAVPVPAAVADGRSTLDLDAIGAALAAGARTVLLAQPDNPGGRVHPRDELSALRGLVVRHGARVICDEVHAPLVLPGTTHLPYAALEDTADHVTTVLAASKAWNMPGLRCAQIVAGNARDHAALARVPQVANRGAAPIGIAATVAAYDQGGRWLDSVVAHLDRQRSLFGRLLERRLPSIRWTPMDASYLAWLDAGAAPSADPADDALRRGRVLVNHGGRFGPGCERFVRVNLATSAERLHRIVNRLEVAWTTPTID